MHMISGSSNAKNLTSHVTTQLGHVGMQANAHGIANGAFALFCGKDDVKNYVGERMCHTKIIAHEASFSMKRPVGTQQALWGDVTHGYSVG